MKRYGHIWDEFASVESAEAAIYNATKHKRQSMTVRRMLGYTGEQIRASPDLRHQLDPDKVRTTATHISELLNSGAWRQSTYKHMSVYNPSSGKTREIDCPSLTDHIIHWMLVTALQKPLTRGMYKYCCGSVPGRGIDYARKAVERWAREEKIDILRKTRHSKVLSERRQRPAQVVVPPHGQGWPNSYGAGRCR